MECSFLKGTKTKKRMALGFPMLCLTTAACESSRHSCNDLAWDKTWEKLEVPHIPGGPWAHVGWLRAEKGASFSIPFPSPFTSHWKHCKELHQRWMNSLSIFNTWVCVFLAELCAKFDRDLKMDLFQLRSHRRKRDLLCPDEVQSLFTNWHYLQAFVLWGKNNLI